MMTPQNEAQDLSQEKFLDEWEAGYGPQAKADWLKRGAPPPELPAPSAEPAALPPNAVDAPGCLGKPSIFKRWIWAGAPVIGVDEGKEVDVPRQLPWLAICRVDVTYQSNDQQWGT